MARRRLRHNANYVKATTEYTTTRTELISAPASWTQCVFQTFFFGTSGFAMLISWTLHRKLCIDMKKCVQETLSSLILKYCLPTMTSQCSGCLSLENSWIRRIGEEHAFLGLGYYNEMHHTSRGQWRVRNNKNEIVYVRVLHGPGLGPWAGPARSPWAGSGQASMIFCGPDAGLKLADPGRARAGK